MRKIWTMALNDVRLTVRDRSAFIWMLVMPLALMWLFGNAGDSSGGSPKVSLTVVDHDGGWLARAFVEELADEQISMTELTPEAAETAEDKVRSLVIPAGFTDGVLSGAQQTLRLEKEAGSNQEFGLAGQMHIVRTIVRTLGRVIEMESDTPAGRAPDSEAERERFRALGERPQLVRLDVSTAGEGHPVPGGFQQSVPGMLTMVVLMMTLVYGAVFLTVEKKSGMLRRQVSLPVSRMQIYLGKLLGRVLIAGCQLAVLVVAGRLLFDFSWGRSPLGLALMLIGFAVATAGLATLLGALLNSPEAASAVGWIGSMLLAGLGGCWWPSEVMPDWLRSAAHLLPTAWAMDGFHALISFGRGFEGVILPAGVLFGFGLVFALLGARFLRFA